jgi:RNA polymerase sigma-70 factor (ECF subfamily)
MPVETQHPGPGSTDFTTFMRAYQDMVFTTAGRLCGSDAQAEDIAQEVFVRAYEHFDALKTSVAAGGWLKAVATNLAINHYQRYSRRWRLFADLRRTGDETSADFEPEWHAPGDLLENLDLEERAAAVHAALKRLPEAQRVPLVLYHFEDMPYQDIASRLEISLAKVKTDIRRGRIALASMLEGNA